MYTGTPAQDWTALHAQGAAAVQRAEAGMPWEQEAPRTGSDQDSWLLSFIDVLTLLLTLFVLLLAYQQGDVKAVRAEMRSERKAAVVANPAAQANEAAVEQVPIRIPATPGQPATTAQLPSVRAVDPTRSGPAPSESAPSTFTEAFSGRDAWFPLDGISAPVSVDPPLPAETHPLLWLGTASWQESPVASTRAPEPDAGAAPKADPGQKTQPVPAREPDGAPLQRLLADLENSALAGRVEVKVLPDAVNLEISDNILFAPASAALTGGGRGLLDDLAATLKTLPYALSVEGHTDNVPIRTARFPSNWELAAARASAVTRHLIEQGVAADRVRAIGYADTRPRAENATPEGRARNRRVAFILRMSMP